LFTAVGMWGLVVAISSLAATLVASLVPGRTFYPAITSEVLYGLVSLLLIQLTGGMRAYSVLSGAPAYKLVLAVSISLTLSLLMTGLARRGGHYEPPYLPKGAVERAVLLLVIAPLGEELLFRGLLEGYLLLSLGGGSFSMAVAAILPAILFSAVHYIPYREAPPTCLRWILTIALVAGLVAGFFRIYANSLMPAVLTHSCFNLGGMIGGRLGAGPRLPESSSQSGPP